MASATQPRDSESRDDEPVQTHAGGLSTSVQQEQDRSNEGSPLLGTISATLDDPSGGRCDPASVDNSQSTKSLWYIIMLTLGIGGLQIAWSVELSNGSPYLLSLGLSKSLMALVWIAGPLTGTLVVPYVGILSDNSRFSWGKRRPFMVGGTVATVVSLLFLAWVQEIVGGILGIFGADAASGGVRTVVIVAAVIGIYMLDIAINTVQAALRAFIVDCAPAHQQELANAMASRLTGIGNIIGFMAGYADLPAHLWVLGDTQFKILCAIASTALAITVALSSAVIHERNPQLDGPARKTPGIITFFLNIFCAWVGFFPLLFYSSSYIGEIYVQPYLEKNPNMTPKEIDALYEQATRIGTFALLINAIVSLSTNVFLPFFIAPTFDSQPVTGREPDAAKSPKDSWLAGLRHLQIPGFTLKRAWLLSLILFAGVMFCTPFVRSVAAATVLIGLAGITWAMALWAPWAIISAEISRRDALDRARKLSDSMSIGHAIDHEASADVTWDSNSESAPDADASPDQAGVILGIHNMAIAVPQIIATVGSSIIFKIWQKPRGTPGDHSIGIVMALGGVCVLASTLFAARIKDAAAAPAHHPDGGEDGQERAGLVGPA